MQGTAVAERDRQTEEWTLDRLKAMRHGELVELYRQLPAPALDEMNGEYRARLLDQAGPVMDLLMRYTIVWTPLNGLWLGKAFQPLEENRGHGYNFFRRLGKVIRKYPMRTEVRPSRLDGRDAYLLMYGKYRSLLGYMGAVDEVRRLDHELYLAMGVSIATRTVSSQPVPFAMVGPPQPFVGPDRPARPM